MPRQKKPSPMGFEETREHLHRQMMSAVSHDLKTPLATMIGSLEIYLRMEDRLSPEKKTTLVTSALGEAYRLDQFITNILDMAKLEGGMVKLKHESVEMTSVIREGLTRLGPRAKAANIVLHPFSDVTEITTDGLLFGRAVSLVVDNALKHAGKEAQIVIEYGVEEGSALVRVCDNGPGIPKGKEEEIFCKYTRFTKNDQQNAGTGLGLAITRQIMVLLNGSVNVQNSSTGGAVFTLSVPSGL